LRRTNLRRRPILHDRAASYERESSPAFSPPLIAATTWRGDSLTQEIGIPAPFGGPRDLFVLLVYFYNSCIVGIFVESFFFFFFLSALCFDALDSAAV